MADSRLGFSKSTVSEPQDVILRRVPVTPEWREANERKQLAYEVLRAQWRKLVG